MSDTPSETETVEALTPKQIEYLFTNHSAAITALQEQVITMSYMLAAYSLQYPLDLEKLKSQTTSDPTTPEIHDHRSVGAYL